MVFIKFDWRDKTLWTIVGSIKNSIAIRQQVFALFQILPAKNICRSVCVLINLLIFEEISYYNTILKPVTHKKRELLKYFFVFRTNTEIAARRIIKWLSENFHKSVEKTYAEKRPWWECFSCGRRSTIYIYIYFSECR